MIELDIQNPADFNTIPENTDLQRWSDASIQDQSQESSMVIRFVAEEEGIALNHTYRHKNTATNVLSFPFETPDIPELDNESSYLGDLVLCEPVVAKEAVEQNKTMQQHWAHLIVHGTLHLQGYDHLKDGEAVIMESLEIKILKGLGFKNPYETPR